MRRHKDTTPRNCLYVDFEGGETDVRALSVYWAEAPQRYRHWRVGKDQAGIDPRGFLSWFREAGRTPAAVMFFGGKEPQIMVAWAPSFPSMMWVDIKSTFLDKSSATHFARHHVGIRKKSGQSYDECLESYERVYGLVRPKAIWSRSKFYPELNGVGTFSPLMVLSGIRAGEATAEEIANLDLYCRWDAESMYRICQAGFANDGRAAITPGSRKL